MRAYSVAIAALALEVDSKWLDNLLSQNRVDGVSQSRQGVQRRLSPGALYTIATVRGLNRDLHIPIATALQIAQELWRRPANDDGSPVELQLEGMALRLGRDDIRTRVDEALAGALEMGPRTRRGRPPKNRTAEGRMQ